MALNNTALTPLFYCAMITLAFAWGDHEQNVEKRASLNVSATTDFHERSTPAPMQAPPFGGFSIDHDTGHKVWRLGGSQAEMQSQLSYPDGQEAISATHAQHFYSRTTPTNQSETYILGSAGRQKPLAALWRMRDKKLVAWVPSATPEANLQQRQLLWDKNQDNVYWFTEANRLMRATIDFKTYAVTTRIWDTFEDFNYITFGFGEGTISDDGDRIVLAGELKSEGRKTFQAYQIESRKKHTIHPATAETAHIDWYSVDPTGQYIVFCQSGPENTWVLPFENAALTKPWLLFADSKHSDFVLDKQGIPWLVYGDWRGLFAARLRDSFNQRIWPTQIVLNQLNCSADDNPLPCVSAAGHVSRIAEIPGTVLVSRIVDGGLYFMNIDQPGKATYVGNSRQGKGPPEAKNRKLAAPWGVTRDGEVTVYLREPRAAVSASGKYVFFTSDYQYYGTHKGSYQPEPPNRAFLNMVEIGN